MNNEKVIYIAECGCGYENGRTDRQVLACPEHLYAGMLAKPSQLITPIAIQHAKYVEAITKDKETFLRNARASGGWDTNRAECQTGLNVFDGVLATIETVKR